MQGLYVHSANANAKRFYPKAAAEDCEALISEAVSPEAVSLKLLVLKLCCIKQ